MSPKPTNPFQLELILDRALPGFALLRFQLIKLTTREWKLLLLLAEQPGRLVTREDLYNHLWNKTYQPEPQQIDQQLHGLRKKLNAASPNAGKLIVTIHGQGLLLDLRPHQVLVLPQVLP